MRFRGIVYRAHNPRWSWPPVSSEGARLHSDDNDLNLVLWRWGDRPPSHVVLIDDEVRLAR